MVTSVAKGGTQKLPRKLDWLDHSLESSQEALSDGTIGFSIQPLLGRKINFLIFFSIKKPQFF
jgi:hypothetical protein